MVPFSKGRKRLKSSFLRMERVKCIKLFQGVKTFSLIIIFPGWEMVK